MYEGALARTGASGRGGGGGAVSVALGWAKETEETRAVSRAIRFMLEAQSKRPAARKRPCFLVHRSAEACSRLHSEHRPLLTQVSVLPARLTDWCHRSLFSTRLCMSRTCGLLAALLVSAGCSQQQKQQQDPTIIATVNGEPIGRTEFEQQLAREAQAMEGGPRTPDQVEPYKQALLDTMVQHLLLLQVARDQGVTVTSEEVDRRVLALSSEYPAGTFDEALAQSQTTRAALIRSTREALIIEKLLQQQVFDRIAITEEQLRRAYDEQAAEFSEPEMVHAQQIVVKGLDEAKRIQQQVWQGKKFSELARRYSLSADAKVGGDLGFFARGQMPPAFDEAVFKLAVNAQSEVVSTDYGFHLFKVLEKRPARKKELQEVRGQLEQKLLVARRTEAQQAFCDELRAKATVKVNTESLQAVSGRVVSSLSPEP